mmetsp:Transcript_4751/g.11216  ORF Transcript_4751/g.11216 Transcript_4751/m.11216 type:complete len:230 (+) Transcript_4751:2402-3091(+)
MDCRWNVSTCCNDRNKRTSDNRYDSGQDKHPLFGKETHDRNLLRKDDLFVVVQCITYLRIVLATGTLELIEIVVTLTNDARCSCGVVDINVASTDERNTKVILATIIFFVCEDFFRGSKKRVLTWALHCNTSICIHTHFESFEGVILKARGEFRKGICLDEISYVFAERKCFIGDFGKSWVTSKPFVELFNILGRHTVYSIALIDSGYSLGFRDIQIYCFFAGKLSCCA